MPRPKNSQPSYTFHKPSGQARVRIDGQDYYLGPYQSPQSWQAYYTMLGKLAAGETRPDKPKPDNREIPLDEFVARYLEYAERWYGPSFASEKFRIFPTARIILELFGRTPLHEFSPLKLQRVVDQLIANGSQRHRLIADRRCDRTIRNLRKDREKGKIDRAEEQECTRRAQEERDREKALHRPLTRQCVIDYLWATKRMFSWAVSQEIYPETAYRALLEVQGPRKGRGQAATLLVEQQDVKPVSDELVAAVLPHVGPEIAAMIQVQRLAGMRPDEVTILRPCDIQKTDPCWTYTPETHKNAWRDEGERQILLGPRAQKILAPFLASCVAPTDYLFSPQKVAARVAAGKTDVHPKKAANFARLNQVAPPRAHYDDGSYAQAVRRGCKKAGIDVWTPNRLRHSAGTEARARFGAEASQLVLGHANLKTTEIYAEKDMQRYAQIMAAMG